MGPIFLLSVVYGPSEDNEKHQLLDELALLKLSTTTP
jgi:hypothetical protein